MASIYDKASLVLIPSGTKTSKVYSQKPTNGDGDFTFSRSTAATRVNASGNIEKETQNLLLQSNSFDTTWSPVGISVTGGQSGYDGSNDAWSITPSATSTSCRITQPVNTSGVQTFSVYAKANGGNGLALRTNDSAVRAWFDLSDGTTDSLGPSAISQSIEDIGNDWYRCSMSFSQSVTSIRFYISDSAGDYSCTSGNGVYLQDAQLEQGLVARDYIETTTAAIYGGITDNVPRLDYTDSSCPALLLEPQRTNLFRNSEYFGYWTNYGGSSLTITPNYSDSPEGVSNSYRLQKNAFTYARLDRTLSGVSSGTLTYSLFVKGDDVIKLRVDAPSETPEAFIDCSDGTITNHSNTPWDSISSVDYGDGWYRFICTHTFTNTPTIARIYPMDAVNGASNTNAADVQVYGAQLELGSYATSYIPTYGSAVTRNNEVCQDTSLATLSNNYSIFAEVTRTAADAINNLEFLDYRSSSNDRLRIYTYNNGRIRFRTYFNDGTNDSYFTNSGDWNQGDTIKFCFTYDNGSIVIYANGEQLHSVSQTLNNLSSIYIETQKINTLLHFETTLTDQEAIDLTTL